MIEQFSLEKYLENPSRKVITRDGRLVEILKVDAKGKHPIIGIYQFSDTEDMESSWRIDGRKTENGESSFDLFFADEREKLTEFEKTMIQFSHERNSLIQFEHTTEEINAHLYRYSKKLLDLARNEILKDLPKWKKAEKDEELDCHVAIQQDDRVVLSDFVQKDEYYITLDVLKKLPKEE